MLSAIIATRESERALVPTLAALVPGATAGLLSEVIVADAGSSDATREVADIAGCRFMASSEPLGARLKAAAASTRTPWLLFLRAGCAPDVGWVTSVDGFMQATDMAGTTRAAVFRPVAADLMRPGLAELLALLRAAFARGFYEALDGHPSGGDADAAILRRIGRRRLAMLASAARFGG